MKRKIVQKILPPEENFLTAFDRDGLILYSSFWLLAPNDGALYEGEGKRAKRRKP
jgi:hypothetical protein